MVCSRDWSWNLRTAGEVGKGKLSLAVCHLDDCLEARWTRVVRTCLCLFLLNWHWQENTREGTSFGEVWLRWLRFGPLLAVDLFTPRDSHCVLFVSFCVRTAWLEFSESILSRGLHHPEGTDCWACICRQLAIRLGVSGIYSWLNRHVGVWVPHLHHCQLSGGLSLFLIALLVLRMPVILRAFIFSLAIFGGDYGSCSAPFGVTPLTSMVKPLKRLVGFELHFPVNLHIHICK